jgi:hypothetical protein
MTTQKFYAGIGSRDTPKSVLKQMTRIARELEKRDWTLRSGGAVGADTAFENGVTDPNNKEIFAVDKHGNTVGYELKPWAVEIAEKYHPNWKRVCESEFIKTLISRNTYQIYGYFKSSLKSEFVVCWTVGGGLVGGTAQAIRIAIDLGIPVYNLALRADKQKLYKLLWD